MIAWSAQADISRPSAKSPAPPLAVKAHGGKQALLVAQMRMIVVAGLFFVAFAAIALRLGLFAVLEDSPARARSATELVPPRADILDRNGVPMARTIQAYAIRVVPAEILGNKRDLAFALNRIFPDTSAAKFHKLLLRETPTYLRRRVLPEEANQVHALGEPGFQFPREDERFYPQGTLASHVLGYIGDREGHGIVGLMGVEGAWEEQLAGVATRGTPQVLSIDLRVQSALEEELGSQMLALDAVGAAGIVLDVHTGEVLAMASLPEYNPNQPDPGRTDATGTTSVVFNKVTNQVYELGSTFKPITVAAALDAGTITNLARRYDATRPLQVAGHRIGDSHSAGRWLNVPEALIKSSNVVTAQIADELGSERLEATMRSLHFNQRPAIELAEAGAPIWPSQWHRIENMTIAYGHGMAVTPLHLANAYAALVNGGIYRPATLRRLEPGKAPRGTRVFSAATSARMNQLLRMIVVDGTGRRADAPGFRVGGKTGSADKPGNGGYNRSAVVATFAAAFPMDDPRYVVIAMLDDPKASRAGSRTAGITAAPVIARVIPRIGPMLGVLPDDSRDVDVSELMPLIWRAPGERN